MSPLRLKRRYSVIGLVVGVFLFLVCTNVLLRKPNNTLDKKHVKLTEHIIIELLNKIEQEQPYDNKIVELVENVSRWKMEHDMRRQIIFVGGVPRSGTTLMRVLLDAHREISCGQETRIIPRILRMYSAWSKSEREAQRLSEASLDQSALNRVMAVMLMQIFREQSEGRPEYYCNKDPFNLAHVHDLEKIFPNAKYILMVRDGRAVTHSITTRGVTIFGLDIKDKDKVLGFWNNVCENMINQCTQINRKYTELHCLQVFYDNLILDTESELKRVFEFLRIGWDSRILHHEQIVDNGEIKLSKLEPSTNQVSQAIYNESLYKWKSELPSEFLEKAHETAPLLTRLGYT